MYGAQANSHVMQIRKSQNEYTLYIQKKGEHILGIYNMKQTK